jgi:tetratricopeptide (TPR) repeat protein
MVEMPAISREAVAEELDRLLDSAALRRSPSHMRLLRYLVEKRVAGDEAALRETAIAFEVFKRDPGTYDPQTDPIVRVTVGRLRRRLDANYAAHGGTPHVRIALPKGRYVPEFTGRSDDSRPSGIAVSSTRNQTGDPSIDARCDAFADRLRDHLAQAGLPNVHRRRSASDEAGTAWLMESTLAREHERELRLSIRLLDAVDGTLRWVETAVAQAAELHSLLDRMLDIVLMRTLDTLPLPSAIGATASSATALPRAQRVALDQAHLMLVQRNLRGTEDAVALAQAAVDAHPHDADAWATLGAALYSRLSFMDSDEAQLLAALRASIERALALAPDHPVALRTKAILVGKCEYDAATAESLFRRSLRSLPHYTSARLNLAELLALQGKSGESLAELNLARLYDPLSPSVLLARAMCLDLLRERESAGEAWALCSAVGEASLWVLTGTGAHHLIAGDVDAASRAYDDAAQRFPTSPVPPMGQAYVLARRGRLDDARTAESACVARFAHASPAGRAVLAAWMGERDRVISLLMQARARKDMDLLHAAIHPALDPYARDAEVQRLLPLGGYAGLR